MRHRIHLLKGLAGLFPCLSQSTSLGNIPQGAEDIMGENTVSVLLALEAQQGYIPQISGRNKGMPRGMGCCGSPSRGIFSWDRWALGGGEGVPESEKLLPCHSVFTTWNPGPGPLPITSLSTLCPLPMCISSQRGCSLSYSMHTC